MTRGDRTNIKIKTFKLIYKNSNKVNNDQLNNDSSLN